MKDLPRLNRYKIEIIVLSFKVGVGEFGFKPPSSANIETISISDHSKNNESELY